MPHRPDLIHYTELPLERAADSRRDPDWLAARLGDKEAHFLLVHEARSLLCADTADPRPRLLNQRELDTCLGNGTPEPILLGLSVDDPVGSPLIALDVSTLDDLRLESATNGIFMDLRRVGAHIDPRQGSLLGFARGLVHWHGTSRFCPRCGGETRMARGGFSRRCLNEACQREHFPRNDPAVIMLVEYRPDHGEPLCLLGRNHRFKNGMFSTLAGFVDAGESLEQAVRREVFEEAGVRTFDERYLASQPWPFPGSLMLGFTARTRDRDITIDPHEIAEARWFSVDELRAMREFYAEGNGPCLPRRDSIARYLIDGWIDACDKDSP